MLQGKIIAILAEDDFEDEELVEPLQAMKQAGAEVVVVGTGMKETVVGRKGATVAVNAAADEVKAEDFDAIIVPGGRAASKMRLHRSMLDLVRQAYDLGKVIAAVCHGPQVLISAGVVKDHRVTSWPAVAMELRNAGATWVDEPVVQDGKLITSRKPADLPQFNQAIVAALVKEQHAGEEKKRGNHESKEVRYAGL